MFIVFIRSKPLTVTERKSRGTYRQPLPHQFHNRIRRPRARATPQRLVDLRESLHELTAIGTFQLRQQRRTQHLGAHLAVEIFGNQLPASEQIGLREERCLEQFQVLEKKTCEHT